MNGEVVWFGLGVQCFCAGMFRNRKFICAMERNSAENKIVSSICCVLLQIFICSQISHEWHTFLHTKHFESNFSPSAVYCDKFSLFPLELSSMITPTFAYFTISTALCVYLMMLHANVVETKLDFQKNYEVHQSPWNIQSVIL